MRGQIHRKLSPIILEPNSRGTLLDLQADRCHLHLLAAAVKAAPLCPATQEPPSSPQQFLLLLFALLLLSIMALSVPSSSLWLTSFSIIQHLFSKSSNTITILAVMDQRAETKCFKVLKYVDGTTRLRTYFQKEYVITICVFIQHLS